MTKEELRSRFSPEKFPALSDRLRLLVDFVFAESTPPFARIETAGDGAIHARLNDDKLIYLGQETDLVLQLRRLAQVAKLDPGQRQEYAQLVFQRTGLLLTAHFGCHTP